MSNNPLRDLLQIIEAVSGSGNFRSQFEAIESPGFVAHIRGIELLAQTIRACEAISTPDDDVVGDNAELFELLWDQLTMPMGNWDQNRKTELDSTALSSARNLARTLDHAGSLPTVLSVEQVDGLRVALKKLRKEVGAISEIPDNLRNYLIYLIDRALSIMDGDDIDLTSLRSLSFEIAGVTTGIVAVLPEGRRQSFLEHIGKVLGPWFSSVSAGVASGVISTLATHGLILG